MEASGSSAAKVPIIPSPAEALSGFDFDTQAAKYPASPSPAWSARLAEIDRYLPEEVKTVFRLKPYPFSLENEGDADAAINDTRDRALETSPGNPTPKKSDARTAGLTPAYYNKHFDPRLVLSKVVSFSSLTDHLLANLDTLIKEKLIDEHMKLPDIESGDFYNESSLDFELWRTTSVSLKKEDKVVEAYSTTFGNWCTIIASTLLLHPSAPRWRAVIKWGGSLMSQHAIPDGALQFLKQPENPKSEGQSESASEKKPNPMLAIWAVIDEAVNKIIKELIDKDIGGWEFKAVKFSTIDMLTAMCNHQDAEFLWQYCQDTEKICKKAHAKTYDHIRLVRVGFDSPDGKHWALPNPKVPQTNPSSSASTAAAAGLSATHQTLNFTADSYPEITGPPERPGDANFENAHYILQQAWAQAVRCDGTIIIINFGNYEWYAIRVRNSQTLFLSKVVKPSDFDNYGKLQVALFVACLQDALDRQQLKQQESIPDVRYDPYIGKGEDKKRKRTPEGGGSEIDENEDHNKGVKKAKKAKTKRDPSPQAGPSKRGGGNGSKRGRRGAGRGGERSAVRHSTRHDAGRGVINSKGTNLGCGDPVLFTHEPQKYNAIDGPQNPLRGQKREVTSMVPHLSEYGKRDCLLLYLSYGVYCSKTPGTFARAAPAIQVPSSPPISGPSKLEEIFEDGLGICHALRVIIDSEIGEGAVGIAHGGVLELDSVDQTSSMSVVVKLAVGRDAQASLMHEHQVYAKLHEAKVTGIPTIIGIFEDTEDTASALVMTHGGQTLRRNKIFGEHTDEFQSFTHTLSAIHEAGFLHGDLRSANLLVSDEGKTSIIDFHCARQSHSPVDMVDELATLKAIVTRGRH